MASPGNISNACSLIKESIDIVEFCEETYNAAFIPGHKGWYNTNCLMPNHEDKDPSFGVNRETAKFRCFSCGEAGSIIDLVMKVENIGLQAAVSFLLNYLNITIDPASQKFMSIRRMLKGCSGVFSKEVLLDATISQFRKHRLQDENSYGEYYEKTCDLFEKYYSLEYQEFKNYVYYDR